MLNGASEFNRPHNLNAGRYEVAADIRQIALKSVCVSEREHGGDDSMAWTGTRCSVELSAPYVSRARGRTIFLSDAAPRPVMRLSSKRNIGFTVFF